MTVKLQHTGTLFILYLYILFVYTLFIYMLENKSKRHEEETLDNIFNIYETERQIKSSKMDSVVHTS